MKKTYSRVPRQQPILQQSLPKECSNICRLCLRVSLNNIGIFSTQDSMQLSAKLKFCIGIKPLEDDGLPTAVCEKCYGLIKDFSAFKEQCLTTDRQLKQHLNNQNLLKTVIQNSNEAETSKNISEECNELDNSINLLDADNGLENVRRISCLLEEDNIYPDAPDDVIVQIKKEIEKNSSEINSVIPVENEKQDCTSHSSGIGTGPPVEEVSVNIVEGSAEENGSAVIVHSPEDINVYKCKACRLSFSSQDELVSHDNEHHSIERLCCTLCSKLFTGKRILERHMRIHTGKKPYQCEICKKCFVQKESRQRHLKLHRKKSHFACSVCPKVLVTSEGLKCHMLTHHTYRQPHELQRFKCKLCVKAFCHSSGLSRHLLSHSGVLYSCEICYKTFSDGSSLRRHVHMQHPKGPNSLQSPLINQADESYLQ